MLAARPSITTSSSNPLYPAPLSTYQSRPSIASTISSNDTPSTPSTSSPSVTTPITKEWTLQPRPKPGRKPALDVPPTKRKAQNREAQRAFRERRAQRVGELEEKVQQDQDIFKHKEEQWRSLEASLVKSVDGWRDYARYHESQANLWKDQAQHFQRQLEEVLQMNQHLSQQVEQLQHANWTQTQQAELPTLPSMPSLNLPMPITQAAEKCKTCDPSQGNCACLNEFTENLASEVKEEDSPMEIDFTNGGKSASNPITIDQATTELIGQDGCGFCKKPGGAECPCTSSGLMEEVHEDLTPVATILPPTQSTPAPLVSSEALRNAPGSCAACQIDPERRRFCQTLGGLMAPPPRPGTSSNDENEMDFTSTFSTNNNKPKSIKPMVDTPMQDIPTLPTVDALLAFAAVKARAGENLGCADAYSLFQGIEPKQRDRERFIQLLRPQPPRQVSVPVQQPQPKICGSSGKACGSGCTVDTDSAPQQAGTKNASNQEQNYEQNSITPGGLPCFTCKDTGCAPMEVDAASVLIAMQQGRMPDYRAKMRLRSLGSEEMDGSD